VSFQLLALSTLQVAIRNPPIGSCPMASHLAADTACTSASVAVGSDKGATWALEPVNTGPTAGPRRFRIRSVPRGKCGKRYLGALKAKRAGDPPRDCGRPQLGLYSASDAAALTVWTVVSLPDLPSPPPPKHVPGEC